MTIKQYNVAKVNEDGVEIIQMYPYITKNEARAIRIQMKRTFPMHDYVVINVPTYLGVDTCHQS